MANELVSIIIPVYNTAKDLDGCLRSVAAQSDQNIEVLLMDDGSQDESADICRAWAQKDARFRYFPLPHGGVSAARNAGIDAARGKYLLFIDSDDTVSPDYAALLVRGLRDGCELCVCNYYECDFRTGERLPKDYCMGRVTAKQFMLAMAKQPIHNYYGVPWNRIFLREIVNEHGIRFNTAARFGEDTAFFLDYMHFVRTVQTIPECLYNYRYGMAIVNRKRCDRAYIDQNALLLKSYFGFWRDMGWFDRHRPLVLLHAALRYFDLRKLTAAEDLGYLYDAIITKSGISRAEFFGYQLFRAFRKGVRLLRAPFSRKK